MNWSIWSSGAFDYAGDKLPVRPIGPHTIDIVTTAPQPILPDAEATITMPDAPGLGVTLPEDAERRFPYRPGSFYRVLGHPGRRAT